MEVQHKVEVKKNATPGTAGDTPRNGPKARVVKFDWAKWAAPQPAAAAKKPPTVPSKPPPPRRSERIDTPSRCKRCGGRIAWGQFEDTKQFIPLDADCMPHGCRVNDQTSAAVVEVTDTSSQPTGVSDETPQRTGV